MKLVLCYWVIISAVAVAVTILDKRAARVRAIRVPESVLLLLAALGGGLAMYVTMLIIRHKTRKPKFMFGIPLIMLMQIMLILLASWLWGEAHL